MPLGSHKYCCTWQQCSPHQNFIPKKFTPENQNELEILNRLTENLNFALERRPRPAKNPVASSNPGYREPQRDRLVQNKLGNKSWRSFFFFFQVHCAKAGLPRSTSLGKQDEGPSLAELAEFGYVPAERYLDTSKQVRNEVD